MPKWTVKVRVISRSEIREWTKGDRQGRVCNADFADAEGGEIRAVAFNEFADALFASAEPGSVVTISNGALKPTVTILTTCNHHSVSGKTLSPLVYSLAALGTFSIVQQSGPMPCGRSYPRLPVHVPGRII